MDLIYIGKIVNTHGLKGEIRIISDFKYKKDVFKIDNIVYINNNKFKIKSYRYHKIYDMVTLENINSIEEAENFKGLNVYDKDKYKGKVVDVLKTNTTDFLVIDGIKKHMVPNIPEFVKEVDLNNKKIYIEYIRGLDNED